MPFVPDLCYSRPNCRRTTTAQVQPAVVLLPTPHGSAPALLTVPEERLDDQDDFAPNVPDPDAADGCVGR
jgi:hypothetical protein